MPLTLAGATAIQSGVNIGSGLINNLFQKRNVKLQTDANKELSDYAYSKDLEMWHLQNLHNSPKMQMQRFKEAGLNPNLIYGKGTSGNASAMPKAQQVTAGKREQTMPKMDMLGMYQNVRQNEANIAGTMASTQQSEAATTLAMTKNAIASIERDQKDTFWKLNKPHAWSLALWDRTKKKVGLDQQNQAYQLQKQKQTLQQLQADLAIQRLLTEQRKYKWMPWEKGFGLAGKAIGSGIGIAGVGKLSKLRTPAKPKFSKYSRNDYRNNRDINPNYGF